MAAYLLSGRHVLKSVSLGGYTTVAYSVCFSVGLILALIYKVPLMVDTNIMIICLLLAVVSTVLGHSLISWSLQYVSAVFVTVIFLGEPVGASIIAFFMFGTIPGVIEIIGGVIVLLSIAVLVHRVNARRNTKI